MKTPIIVGFQRIQRKGTMPRLYPLKKRLKIHHFLVNFLISFLWL